MPPTLAAHPKPVARVVLVGFEDQDNLGLRYLSGRLKEAGHETRIVAFGSGAAPILEACRAMAPQVVGFSLIFQYMVPQFRAVIGELRAAGVTAHFTMGGHYASFEPEALLTAIPQLDSVVRYEGEDALLELTERLASGASWVGTAGVAHRAPDGVGFIHGPARAGRDNLDELPWPDRDDINYGDRSTPIASMLGSRGCPWVCSFCSIITFYEGNGTKGRRRRDPARVVDELEYLHRERGVEVILWQDDDFLAGGPVAVRWAHAVAAEAMRRGLHHGLRWKLSCRSDEVTHPTIAPLVDAGLAHVYLGVESGDEESLKHFNKRLKPDVHLRARDVMRACGVTFDFGFMLLEPWSTIETVRGNVRFLREFVGDGSSPATFCRMLPYVGTAAQQQLRAEGRFYEHDLQADYDFLDPRLDVYYEWMLRTFDARNFTRAGTLNLLRILQFQANLRKADPKLDAAVRSIIAANNMTVFDLLDAALAHVESTPGAACDDAFMQTLTEHHRRCDAQTRLDVGAFEILLESATTSLKPYFSAAC